MERKIQGMAALISVVILFGLLHGVTSGRWQFSADRLEEMAPRLKDVPMVIGSWSGVNQPVEEEEQFTRHGVVSWLVRRYTDRRTGQEVEVMMVCGRAGPIAVHTPDVCYKNAGFHEETAQQRVEVPTEAGYMAQFLTSRFAKVGATSSIKLDIWWCWGCDGKWEAPESARFHYARSPYLYKLYVIRNLPLGAVNDKNCSRFISDCLPTITASIFPQTSGGSESSPR